MYRKYLLLLLLPWALGSFGQSEIHLNIGAKAHPEDFTITNSLPSVIDRSGYQYWPILQANLGYRRYLSRSNWFVEGGMSWRHTRTILEQDLNFPSEVDPNFGFVSDSQTIPYVSTNIYNYGGVKIGGGRRFSSASGRHGLVLPFGIQGHVPFASKNVSKIGDRRSEQPIYNEYYPYENGIFYGLYFKPGYEFSFSRSNPWRFSIYAEGDLLIHNKSDLNPKFLIGGGLGVSYQWGKN